MGELALIKHFDHMVIRFANTGSAIAWRFLNEPMFAKLLELNFFKV
jgi:hypothetical protein